MTNNKLIKTIKISTLFRIYKDLLSSKQKQYLELYIDEDFSLQEIAENFGVSKNAIYDAIQKAITQLEKFEKKMHCHEKNLVIQKIIEEFKSSDSQEVKKILKLLAMEV